MPKPIISLVSNTRAINHKNTITIVDSILRNLYVREQDISKIMSIIYTSINRRNLDIALGEDRICLHGYSTHNCKICSDNHDYTYCGKEYDKK
jgi:hypothetical protein